MEPIYHIPSLRKRSKKPKEATFEEAYESASNSSRENGATPRERDNARQYERQTTDDARKAYREKTEKDFEDWKKNTSILEMFQQIGGEALEFLGDGVDGVIRDAARSSSKKASEGEDHDWTLDAGVYKKRNPK